MKPPRDSKGHFVRHAQSDSREFLLIGFLVLAFLVTICAVLLEVRYDEQEDARNVAWSAAQAMREKNLSKVTSDTTPDNKPVGLSQSLGDRGLSVSPSPTQFISKPTEKRTTRPAISHAKKMHFGWGLPTDHKDGIY